jgi:CheY-like chemotaxis protein
MSTLLLLDDNTMLRTLLETALTRRGFEVIAAEDPAKAIEAAEAHDGRIDLAVLDVMLPKMRCGECVAHLRRARPELKLVYMSGYPRHVAQQQGGIKEDGQFVMKPFTPDVLLRAISHALEAA